MRNLCIFVIFIGLIVLNNLVKLVFFGIVIINVVSCGFFILLSNILIVELNLCENCIILFCCKWVKFFFNLLLKSNWIVF